ncbi:hypothetical protein CCR90_07100 [Rhodovulum sulfidophilum]|nr:hypothetical protein [Rhodovulum sulfidophilum]
MKILAGVLGRLSLTGAPIPFNAWLRMILAVCVIAASAEIAARSARRSEPRQNDPNPVCTARRFAIVPGTLPPPPEVVLRSPSEPLSFAASAR